MERILTAENIHKTYKTASGDVNALKGISYSFEKGKTYSIMGRSGSGKSTFLNVLASLDRPSHGTVHFKEKDVYSMHDRELSAYRRRHTGFVFQQFNLIEEYPVLTNICLPLRLDGKKVDPLFLQEITDSLGLTDQLRKYPSELSGGEQQRVAIARSLIAKPELIFADEPTGNLDKATEEMTIRLLCDSVRKYGQTLILVTHNPEIAERMQERIVMDEGKLL